MVFLSVMGAEGSSIIPHAKVERALKEIDIGATFLRPGFFAQNFQDAYYKEIMNHDRLSLPAKDALVAFVDLLDVARVAARVFKEGEPHFGQGYTLTGPRPVTFGQACALLSEAIGRTIRYEPISIPRYAWRLRKEEDLPAGQIAIQTLLHADLRRGTAAEIDPTLERLLPEPHLPTPLNGYFERERDVWQR